jgi:hypothetical protein
MKPLRLLWIFGVLLTAVVRSASAQTCPALVVTMLEAIQCERDHCKDLSVTNEKGVSKEGIYYVSCIQNFTFDNVRSDEPFVAEIDQFQRTRFPDTVKILSPCDCLDKFAKDYPACKVKVCEASKPAAPALPAPPPLADSGGPTEPAGDEAAASAPVDAAVTSSKDSGGCSLINEP